MKKSYIKIIAFIFAILLLSGCGADKSDNVIDDLPTIEGNSTKSDSFTGGNKVSVTMLSISAMPSLKDAVTEFNKQSDKYNIELIEILSYDENYSNTEWDAAVTKINTMIMSNDAPDILDLTELPADIYYRKGLIENLIPYFENDSELSKEDFFWNVFEAMSVDGALPYITDSVDIRTLAVPKEYANGKTSWAFSDLTSMFNSNNRYYVGNTDGLGFILNILKADNTFLDVKGGTCSFNSPEFTEILQIANELNKSYSFYSEPENYEPYSVSSETIMSSVMVRNLENYYGNELCLVGIPGVQRAGNFIAEPMSQLAISSTSKCKDGAWEFLKSFLSEEHMRHSMAIGDSAIGLPINRASFETVGENAIKGKDSWCDLYGCKPTKEDVDITRELIKNANVCCIIDGRIQAIIEEEASSFFCGLQTSEETAERIQNAVNLYLNEQK